MKWEEYNDIIEVGDTVIFDRDIDEGPDEDEGIYERFSWKANTEYVVTRFEHCQWQNDEENQPGSECFRCKGLITTNEGFTCMCYNGDAPIKKIIKKDMLESDLFEI